MAVARRQRIKPPNASFAVCAVDAIVRDAVCPSSREVARESGTVFSATLSR